MPSTMVFHIMPGDRVNHDLVNRKGTVVGPFDATNYGHRVVVNWDDGKTSRPFVSELTRIVG